ncbi:MAG: hypothetical protein AAGA29_13370 [Planctomycetota bacterium]
MMRMRYAIVFSVTLLAVFFGAAAVTANQTNRGADIPACRSAQPESDADSPSTAKRLQRVTEHQQADAAQPDNASPPLRFATLTVSIDPKGAPLAAYQFELTAGHAFTVVGLDNANHPCFPDAPRYDRSANANATDRLIVADYTLLPADQLITKPQATATIHAMFTLDVDTDLDALAASVTLAITAAADADGNPIDADITFDLHFALGQGPE